METFAANAASSDASSGEHHGYFDQATAAQPLAQRLLDAERGFGGFDNLVDERFSEAGCGLAKDASGNWWVTIEFR